MVAFNDIGGQPHAPVQLSTQRRARRRVGHLAALLHQHACQQGGELLFQPFFVAFAGLHSACDALELGAERALVRAVVFGKTNRLPRLLRTVQRRLHAARLLRRHLILHAGTEEDGEGPGRLGGL